VDHTSGSSSCHLIFKQALLLDGDPLFRIQYVPLAGEHHQLRDESSVGIRLMDVSRLNVRPSADSLTVRIRSVGKPGCKKKTQELPSLPIRATSASKGKAMIQDLERIEYRRGMFEAGTKPEDLPVTVWSGSQIPSELRAAINAENLLNLGGVHGTKGAGDPTEYDHLKLILTDDAVEIEIFNRGITLLTTEDEKVKRIHRVLSKIDTDKN